MLLAQLAQRSKMSQRGEAGGYYDRVLTVKAASLAYKTVENTIHSLAIDLVRPEDILCC